MGVQGTGLETALNEGHPARLCGGDIVRVVWTVYMG